jgi:dolichyl-diphosphooligosaccharide--protein glycosyltransferase
MAWLLAGLITFAIGLQVRLYPLTRNVSSDAYEQGTMLVIAKIRAMITSQVNAQFPDMPPDQKAGVVSNKVNEVLRKDNAKVRKAFEDVGYQLLQKSGNHKHYLLASDSYYFLALTENILSKGDVSTQVHGSRYFNELMLAPIGYWEPQTWHPYIGALVYKIVKFFDSSTDLMDGVAWTPIFLLPLVIMAFLFACRSMGCSALTSFVASIFFVLAPIYLKRSTFAWYDNDTYSVFFPVLSLGLLFLMLKNLQNLPKALLLSLLCAISMGTYAMFWAGWGFLLGLSAVGLVLVWGKSLLFKENRAKPLFLFSGLLICATSILVGCLYTWPLVGKSIGEALGELQKFTMPKFKDWPDLFIVVGELKKGTLADIIELTGGPLVFGGAVATLLFFVIRLFKGRKSLPDEIIILGIFLAATFVLSLDAQRFTILCLTPLSLLFAFGLEQLWSARTNLTPKLNVSTSAAEVLKKILMTVLILSIIVPTISGQKIIRSLLNPIFNSAWERALIKLRDQSPPESVVDTWWSPGHFVKAIAKRRVTFDGASIKGEQAYWLTKVYLSQSEREALGILRMLNTSSNRAAEYLQSQNMPLSTAVPLILEATKAKKPDAEQALLKILPPDTVTKLLGFTHGPPPPSYVLIYNEIVDGNVLLGYVGKWDFAKIERLNQDKSALIKIPKKSSRHYVDFLWSLVGGPFRQTEPLKPITTDGSRILFESGVSIDTSDMTAAVNSDKYGRGIPFSIVYWDDTQHRVIEKVLPGSTLGYSVVFFRDEGVPKTLLMDRLLANSLIVKMYYFEGQGLKYFKPFAKEHDLTGRTKIYIFEVDWPKEF